MKSDSRVPRIWTPGSLQLWVVIVATLVVILFVGVLMAMPPSWLYNEWAPARDFRDVPLERVVADFEATGLLRKGTTWENEELRHRSVTVRYSFFHEPYTVIGAVAGAAGVVIEAPAYAGCTICGVYIVGPAHIRAPIGSESNVRLYRPKEPPATQESQ